MWSNIVCRVIVIKLPEIHFDQVSFWLGFVVASLLWWLLGRIRLLLPHLIQQARVLIERIRMERLAGVEHRMRVETIRRAQRSHLASVLFSLDEILISPKLLAPPPEQDPEAADQENQSITSRVIPYLPDWPEIVAPFGTSLLTPLEAIQNGRNIAIIGQPGSGKSTALFHLACEINRLEVKKSPSQIAVLLHANDLALDEKTEGDPLDRVINHFAYSVKGFNYMRLKQYLKSSMNSQQRKVIFLLDGLDELSSNKLKFHVDYLRSLITTYPQAQVVVTASADYLDGLTEIGFYPLGIAAWTHNQTKEFTRKWGNLWNQYLAPELKKNTTYEAIDPHLLQNWIGDGQYYFSPLEWTMRIWGAYAGDLSGSSPVEIIRSQINRSVTDPAYIKLLSQIAHSFIQNNITSLPFNEMERLFTSFQIPARNSSGSTTNASTAEQKTQKQKKVVKDSPRPSGEKEIENLLSGGIFIKHADGSIAFSNPVFVGFLAEHEVTIDEANRLASDLSSSTIIETLHFASTRSDAENWIYSLIDDPQAPLFQHIFISSRWLRDAPVKSNWRPHLMRTLVTILQNESTPLSLKIKIIGAFYLSRDPSITKLFQQLLSSQSPTIRRAALIGCGRLGNPQLIGGILDRMSDPSNEVRLTACLALSAVSSEPAINAIVEVLMTGDEELRQAAAESLALDIPIGHELLKEAVTIEDILTRRAAVFGIKQIGQPWARQLLEKLAIEDSQWVVRNAAAHALEQLQKIKPNIPSPLPPPSESPWLLQFASNLGLGIQLGSDGLDVLLMALNSGSEEEQVSALIYLRNHPTEDVISAIYQLLYRKQEITQEAAIYAIWWIARSGYALPNPVQMGVI